MSQSPAPLHILSTIKIRPGKLPQFCEFMPRLVQFMERQDWRLLGAWTHLGGRINVVIDLWQIPDANALPRALGVLMVAAEWPEMSRELAEYVEDEAIQLMSSLPYDPGRIPAHA
jgi:hypothetical protein